MMSDYSVEVSNLTKKYGQMFAVKDISFQVQRGELVGFLGPNGAGKSTTMRILSGLMPATSGAAYICGIPVSRNIQEAQRRIGYMPENNPLPDDMRIEEYLHFRASLKQIPGRKRKNRVQEVMELCELHQHRRPRKLIGALSKGFRQRVGVADTLLSEPDVVIMDEPTIGLDPHQILNFRHLLESLRGKMTVILSSHILEEIEKSCDRVIIINHGHLIAMGSHGELEKEFMPQRRYRLVVKGPFDLFVSKLAAIDSSLSQCDIKKPGSDLFCEVMLLSSSEEDFSEKIATAFAQDAQWRLREVHCVHPSLEEIFLAATKKNWKQGMSKAPFSEEVLSTQNRESQQLVS